MTVPIRTYNAQDVSINVDGMLITGVADGTFVACEKAEDKYEPYVGSQGEVCRTHNAHPMGSITFTLEHTSPSNEHMRKLSNSHKIFPCKVVDMNAYGETSAGGSECWVRKPAQFERAGEVTDVEWVVDVADYTVI